MQNLRPTGFNILPPVIKNLLIINGLFFLADITAEQFGIDLGRVLGLHYIHSEYFKPYQFITHLFMHGSFLHLFSNMFALWMFGGALENVWGPKRFLFFYLFTGLGASLIHSGITWYEIDALQQSAAVYMSNPSPDTFKQFADAHGSGMFSRSVYDFINEWSRNEQNPMYAQEAGALVQQIVNATINIPTVGASGAVFGVLLAFGMLFPNTVLYIYFFFPIKAKYFVFLYAAFEFYAGYQNITGQSASNIAHFAHLGGMLFAFILIQIWKRDTRNFY